MESLCGGVLPVNTRVRHVDGYRGTVRYVGPLAVPRGRTLPPSADAVNEEFWYGVEWDEDGHGKNDGSLQGIVYFVCKKGRGSFLKRNKLLGQVSLLEALVLRYSHDEVDPARLSRYRTSGADPFQRDVSTGAFLNVKQTDCQANADLQCVAFGVADREDAQWGVWDPLHRPAQQFVAVNANCISPDISPSKSKREDEQHAPASVGLAIDFPVQPVHGTLSSWFPNMMTLVLKGTLLHQWSEVAIIARQLPALTTLNVSMTPLGPLDGGLFSAHNGSVAWSSSVKHLAAVCVNGDLSTMTALAAVFPALHEFQFGKNPLFCESCSCSDHQRHQTGCPVNALQLSDCIKKVDQFKQSWPAWDPSVRDAAARVLWSQLGVLQTERCGVLALNLLRDWLHTVRLASSLADDDVAPTQLRRLNISENATADISLEPQSPLFHLISSLWMRGANFPDWDSVALRLVESFPSVNDLIFSDDALLEAAVPSSASPSAAAASSVVSQSTETMFGVSTGGISDYGSRFDQTTLERFRFIVAALPKQIQKLNNSVVSDREADAAERLALSRFLKPYLDALQPNSSCGGQKPTPADIGCPATLMFRIIEDHVTEMIRKSSASGASTSADKLQVYVPRPRLKRDELGVHFVFAQMTFEEMCQHRLDGGFQNLVMNHISESKSRYIATIDIRWSVRQLRKHAVEHLKLKDVVDPLDEFEGTPEEHWTLGERALIGFSIPAGSDDRKTNRSYLLKSLPFSVTSLFPRRSLLMFHFDMELNENIGARDKGLHCKHLVRPSDKLFEHRIADGDAFVVVSFE